MWIIGVNHHQYTLMRVMTDEWPSLRVHIEKHDLSGKTAVEVCTQHGVQMCNFLFMVNLHGNQFCLFAVQAGFAQCSLTGTFPLLPRNSNAAALLK